MTMFNGFHGHYRYNELFFHDQDSGQIIVPVLRPGNSHSNKWYVSILKRGIHRIRAKYPDIEIAVYADSGVNCASCYQLADAMDLKYAIGIASNEVLKRKTARCERAVSHLYVNKEIKQQHSISHQDQAGSWYKPQRCHSKIESKGKGLNVRHIISNLE